MAAKLSRRDFLKGTAAAAVGAAFFGLGGKISASAEEPAIYVPGTYSATAAGYSSDVTVTLTVSETAITDCVIDASGETPDIGQAAAKEMQSLIVETQGVDAVTSATAENTIPAIKKAYADCIQQALIVKTEEPAKEEGFSFEKTEFGTPLWLVPELGMFQWREKPAMPGEFARTESADVVVVGAGLSGICAARRSLELGNSTIILENDGRYDIHGFQCASVNSDFYKRQVEAAGLNWEDWKIDETDFVRNYMSMHNNRTNIDIVKLWTANSGKAFDWYEELMPPQGTDGNYDYRSMIYFPRPEGYDMSQKDHKYKTYIGTVDFTYQSWAQAGRNQVDWIEANGGQFRYNERAYMLTNDGAGRVTGVITKVTAEDGTVTYNKYEAAKGVIVCTGYHGRAKDIMMEIGVEEGMYTLRNGNAFPDSSGFGGSGDGHRMLVWEGADIEPFRQADGCVLSLLDPAAGLALNNNGKRFHNEDDQCWTLGLELRWQPGGRQWKIYDANWRRDLDHQNMSHQAIDSVNHTPWTMPGTLNNENAAPYTNGTKMKADGTECDGTEFYLDILEKELLAGVGNPEGIAIGSYWSWPGDIRYGAETLEELAKMVYPDDEEAQANMLAEVKEYNEMVAKGEDTRYGKAASMLFPIEQGPFFAFSAATSTSGRMGQEGIICNDRLQPVIPSTGKPIQGVYCAGVIVGGRHANCYMTPMGGMNHGFDVTFGKLAAEFLTDDN
jgi:uncharacterized protein with FMN-binding domain